MHLCGWAFEWICEGGLDICVSYFTGSSNTGPHMLQVLTESCFKVDHDRIGAEWEWDNAWEHPEGIKQWSVWGLNLLKMYLCKGSVHWGGNSCNHEELYQSWKYFLQQLLHVHETWCGLEVFLSELWRPQNKCSHFYSILKVPCNWALEWMKLFQFDTEQSIPSPPPRCVGGSLVLGYFLVTLPNECSSIWHMKCPNLNNTAACVIVNISVCFSSHVSY